MGLINGRGGVTPHIRVRTKSARDANSSLSFTVRHNDLVCFAVMKEKNSQLAFRETEDLGLQSVRQDKQD